MADRPDPAAESAELRRLRRRIDALDRRIVGLMNERTELARSVGKVKAADGRRAIRDLERLSQGLKDASLKAEAAADLPRPR